MKRISREESGRPETHSPDSPDSPFGNSGGSADPSSGLNRRMSAFDSDPQLRISEVRLRFPPDQSGTVVAYASCLINDSLLLNDIRIERGHQGGLVIVYPSKPSSTGKRHSTFNPVTREAGEALREALLGGLARLVDPERKSSPGGAGER